MFASCFILMNTVIVNGFGGELFRDIVRRVELGLGIEGFGVIGCWVLVL